MWASIGLASQRQPRHCRPDGRGSSPASGQTCADGQVSGMGTGDLGSLGSSSPLSQKHPTDPVVSETFDVHTSREERLIIPATWDDHGSSCHADGDAIFLTLTDERRCSDGCRCHSSDSDLQKQTLDSEIRTNVSEDEDSVDGSIVRDDDSNDVTYVTPSAMLVSDRAEFDDTHGGHDRPAFAGLMYKACTVYDLSQSTALSDEEDEDDLAAARTSWTHNLRFPPERICDDSIRIGPKTHHYDDHWANRNHRYNDVYRFTDCQDTYLTNDHLGLSNDYKRARTRDFWADDEEQEESESEEEDDDSEEGTYDVDAHDDRLRLVWDPPVWSNFGPCPGKRTIGEYRLFTPGYLDVIAEDDELATTAGTGTNTADSNVNGSCTNTMERQHNGETNMALENGLYNGDLEQEDFVKKKQNIIYIEEHVNGGDFMVDPEETLLGKIPFETDFTVEPSADGIYEELEDHRIDSSCVDGPCVTDHSGLGDVTREGPITEEQRVDSEGSIPEASPDPQDPQEDGSESTTDRLVNMEDLDKIRMGPDSKPITVTETVTLTTVEYLANGQTRTRTEIIKTTKTVEPINPEHAGNKGTSEKTEHPEDIAMTTQDAETEQVERSEAVSVEAPIVMQVKETLHTTPEPPPPKVTEHEEHPKDLTSQSDIVTAESSPLVMSEPTFGVTSEAPYSPGFPEDRPQLCSSVPETPESPAPKRVTVNITVEASVQPPPDCDPGKPSDLIPGNQPHVPLYLNKQQPYNALLIDADVIADLVYSRFRPSVDKRRMILLLFPPPYQNLEPEEVKEEVIQPVTAAPRATLPPLEAEVLPQPEEEKQGLQEVTSDLDEAEPKTARKKGNIFRRMVRAVRRAFNRG